ncbi:hypothetical protein [Pseudomonas orientalis]|uniref:Sel1 repeat family protein n=1 Tax=Pseudomonas orientalis TaxID=76758 RepID=A0A1H2EHM8_9PSED|nr:hypothetical protein [Pseudomonas orientalis]KRP63503.1 hypothetical protein TU82_20880 [Pseudomonas orientalis]SDT94509.1 hypothetical protein SAMN04490197_1228 [Pseudomonas orientalis]
MYVESKILAPLFTLFTQLNAQAGTLPASLNSALSELNATAKTTGFELFNLGAYEKALLHLTLSGTAGDVESQYAMATCTTRMDGGFHFISDTTRKWLLLAAAQDHIPALIRLGTRESIAKAKELARNTANAHKPASMIYMHILTQEIEWLQMAASSDDAEALYELAAAYRKTPRLLPDPQQSDTVIADLMQRAADAGCRRAVYELAFSEDGVVSVTEKQKRITQLAFMGQLRGLLEYGYALAGLSRDKTRTPRTYGLEQNLPRACAVLKLALTRTAGALELPCVEHDYWALVHQLSDTIEYEKNLLELQSDVPALFKVVDPTVILGWAH